MKKIALILLVTGLWLFNACQNADAPESDNTEQSPAAAEGSPESPGSQEGEGAPPPPTLVVRSSAVSLLEQRMVSYQDQLAKIGNKGVVGQRSIDMVQRYLSTLNLEQISSKYLGAATVLTANIKRKGGEERQQFTALLRLSTQVYLDYLVASDAGELHEGHRNTLQTVADLLQDTDTDPGVLLEGWDPAPLQGNAQILSSIQDIL